MILVFGGAYQGKLEYVRLQIKKELSVFQCTDTTVDIDFSKDAVNSFHLLVLAHIRKGIDTLTYLQKNIEQCRDKIVICDDISGGVVPIDKEARLWRETVGRCMTFLAKNSDEVVRVFCGMGTVIK